MDEKREECGVVAVISKNKKPVAPLVYRGMVGVQHRGQDAAGMVLYDGSFYKKKGMGLVSEVIGDVDLSQPHWAGIAHTRYPTTATATIKDVQPSVSGSLAVAHNGHIANYWELRKELEEKKYVFEGTVDSEVILYLLTERLREGASIKEAVLSAMEKLDGAYSVVGIYDRKLFVFRDPHGIRPLVYGENEGNFVFCSESTSLDMNGVPYGGSVGPGELIIIDENGERKDGALLDKGARHCMFEYVYFSRPDSIINGRLVEHVRKELGRQLAEESAVEADLVIPVPDTARSAALGFAQATGIEYTEGIIKNRYVGRTFIMPDQESRIRAVRMKINPIKKVIEGKRIVVFDDSIVRGTTIKEVISMLRACKPKEIHLRITCPPIMSPCFYGVDMPTFEELIANNKSVGEIEKYLGVDSLHYISLGGLKKVVGEKSCFACVTGEYLTPAAAKEAKERRNRNGSHKC
ncbi:amidophosphoribosyltransferase [Candidatus Micrarchaeota archaeon]|nr:amidophosphoribosyltransferase [Candidatus Micrarchaeota archaeon]MBD3417730.1 amidophosphoribosyltransferase [Candidatus Micrarchaeota archaeon]